MKKEDLTMKSMMKKLGVMLSVLALALALTGCSQAPKEPEAPVAETQTEMTEAQTPAEAPANP